MDAPRRAALIAASAFFSIAELAVAAARRGRLRQMAEQGDARAQRVIAVQEEPGDFFTGIQIGMQSAIYHEEAVDLISRLMIEHGLDAVGLSRTKGGNAKKK